MSPDQLAHTQPTLIFIPDISGFTEFVNNTEIKHSQHIIEELLEILIDANEMGLEISEIEGDAILFYRQGIEPTAAELLAQVQRMYVQFHAHLKKYESHRICQCGACTNAHNLSLKFITHYGDIAKKHVKDFTKLFGKDVIIAHRLMKNTVRLTEYALFTHDLLNACSAWGGMKQVAWSDPVEGEDSYDQVQVRYCYLSLKPLQTHVPEPRPEDYSAPGANTQMMQIEKVISAPMELVFDVVSDVAYRHHWIPGVKGSDQLKSKITQDGSTHRCIMEANDKNPFFISHSFDVDPDKITWIETEPRFKMNQIFTLQRIGPELTRVSQTTFIKANAFMKMIFDLFMKKKRVKEGRESMDRLSAICVELHGSGSQHANRIMLEAGSPE